MAQKLLEDYSKSETKQANEKTADAPSETKKEETMTEKVYPPIAPENLPPSYFVSATYDGTRKKAVIKLYEPTSGRIYFWYDNTGHQPYCLTNLSPLELEKIQRVTQHPSFDHFETVEKFDPLLNKMVPVTKIVVTDPLAIGGRPSGCIRDIIPEDFPKVGDVLIAPENIKVWESKIKYYQSYIYDHNLMPGMLYEVRDGNLVPTLLAEVEKTVKEHVLSTFKEETAEELEFIEQWARLLEYPAQKFRRVAMDIEVAAPIPTRVPDPREAAYQVVCVSLYTSDNQNRILLLKREGNIREGFERLPAEATVQHFDSEQDLLRSVFNTLQIYPFVLTFNGDDFDLRYLFHRAQVLGLRKSEVPIEVGKRTCSLKYGVHIDLYKFFYNRSIQIYAFSNRYRDVTLDEVGKALIGMGKIKLEKSINEMNYTELAKYCYKDAEITFKLSDFEDELVMKLILVLARISCMPMDDVSRQGVSRWIRNFLQREHRRKGMLIPNQEEILASKGKVATKAIIKGKKY
ncbi:MAG: 3'-5' exonuclease, partial [Candidatus Bathyarchaeia archaeon]